MALVEILLQGRCVNRQIQESLVADMCQLDNIGNSQVAVGDWGRRIAYPGVEIHPNVLISAAIFEGEHPPSQLEKLDGAVYMAEEASLFGDEVSLKEPISRQFPSKEVLSFVFLHSRDPQLDGRLVVPCEVNPQHPFSRLSRWMLEPPSILLDGSLGEWGVEFLEWVRQAYIPDLRIWMSEEGCLRESAGVSSWRKLAEKESQFTALKMAYLALIGEQNKPTEEVWEMETLFTEDGKKEIG